MIFSLLAPGLAAAESSTKTHHSVNDTKTSAKDKVSKRLLSNFDNNEKVTFLVKFKEKSNPAKVAKEARTSAQSSKLSAQEAKFQQRSAVVSDLKSVSIESQQNVTEFLENETKNGHVESFHSYYIVNGMAVTATKEVAQKIAAFAEVEKILPNETRELHEATVTDEEAPQSTLANVEWNVERVNAPGAWAQGFDGTGTVVASIDTGVQWDHPALKEKYRGYNAATEEVDHASSWFDPSGGSVTPLDDHGHGTHVTGTMTGSEPDGSNQVGVAPGAKWIAAKVFDEAGFTTDDILLDAAEWMLAPGGDVNNAPDVVNNSWGGGPGLDEWYRDAVIAWRAAEIFPEFSAGNTTFGNPGGPGSVAVPANYPESFATGATDVNNKVANFSLRGPSPYGEVKPDIIAPGVNIRSSVPGGGYEGGWNGTSMSGPAVAAVAALLRQVNAAITVDEMEEILLSTTTPLTDSEYPEVPNNAYGHGLVDAVLAIAALQDGLGTVKGQVTIEGEDTEAPTFEHKAPSKTYRGANLNLNIDVTDNVSVSSVKVNYQVNDGEEKTLDAKRKSGNYKNGNYVVTIPGGEIDLGSITYEWKINDFGNNEVTSDEYEVLVETGISIGYTQDFEATPDGWSSNGTNDTWEWGVPTTGPGKAFSGEKVYATNLDGNYAPEMNATLSMPPVELPADGEAYLQFNHWHSFESYGGDFSYDFGYVVISTDQENWSPLMTVTGYTADWESAEINLSDYAGETVFIGFKATSDPSFEEEGWYIDDIALTNTSLNLVKTTDKKTKDLSKEQALALAEKKKAEENKTVKEETTKVEAERISPSVLPLGAQVSVIETGKSVATNPADGSYKMILPVGEFTLKAGAYGYESKQQTVTIKDGEETNANFTLEESVKGTIEGLVTDKKTGSAIEGATILLVEDANILPVKTDTDGSYSITAYEGTYTLKVFALGYHGEEVEVTVDEDGLEIDVSLEPHYTYPGGEIGYDDGTAENARAFYDGGNGWAVKMSLPEGKNSAIVTDGVFRFWDTEWPVPGGTEFAVEVWDAGANGNPGKKLAGPINATALRDGTWTVVDLMEHNIVVDGDFYMVYIQTKSDPNAPGLGTDENGPNAGRSYQYIDGQWEKTPADEGNYMIRARVSYEIGAPTITSPVEGLITNEADITVQGTASPTTTVKLTNNGEAQGSAEIGEDGKFAVNAKLTEGMNELIAITSSKGEDITESHPVVVTLDTVLPELTLDSPVDGDITNQRTVIVEGIVSDEHLDSVTVNGEKASVEENGSYAKEIIVKEGENEITVVAADLAGNTETKTVTITVNQTAPVIENLQPSKDLTVKPGDEVEVTFESSSKGGEASFTIQLPGQKTPQSSAATAMEEVTPGFYKGIWTVPEAAFDNAVVIVELTDIAGNKSTEEATGTITIVSEELPGEIDRIFGPDRYQTAIEISQNGWESADTVIVARGDNFADALAGVPLAHSVDAPILLTQTKKLTDGVLEEIERLGASIVIVLGGENAVSEIVENKLTKANLTVERAGGANRFATAAAIANLIAPNGSDEVVIANGMDFPDALSVASHAAQAGTPILLTTTDEIPAETQGALDRLGAKNTIAVGGKTVISEAVEAELPNATRLGGKDRYITNTLIAEHYNVDNDHLYVATGTGYADALTGAALAAKADSAVLLVHARVPETVSAYITDQEVKDLTIFGGESAVSEKVFNELKRLID